MNFYSHPELDDIYEYDDYVCPECGCRNAYSNIVNGTLVDVCYNCGNVDKTEIFRDYNMFTRPFDLPLKITPYLYGES